MVKLAKRFLLKSPGFTLPELMVAMMVGGFVMAGVFAVWIQLFNVTATNSNYMAAFHQVQNSGDWISNDALQAQQVYDRASTNLCGDIGAGDDEITVDDSTGFPPFGVICIGNEFIHYAGKETSPDHKFTGCIRGTGAVAHTGGDAVTAFLTLDWTDWAGDYYQTVYNLKESGEMVRSRIVGGSLQSSVVVAEAIDVASTNSTWGYGDKELEVVITAQVGDEVVTRTYKVHPRPFF